MKCLPKVFPVFSPFLFSTRCLYSAYVLLIVLLLALSIFYVSIVFFRLVPCLGLWQTLNILLSYAVECLPLVYQQYHQKAHYRLRCFQHQPLPLLHVETATI